MDDSVVFVAIDPAINSVGVSVLRLVDAKNKKFELLDKTTLKNKSKYTNRWKRKLDMLQLFQYYLESVIEIHKDELSFFVIENYSYGSPGKLADLGEMIGLFKFYIHNMGLGFEAIAPLEVKKIITGNGRASKEEVRESLDDFLENKVSSWNSFDESDSVAVGIAFSLKMLEELEKDECRKS